MLNHTLETKNVFLPSKVNPVVRVPIWPSTVTAASSPGRPSHTTTVFELQDVVAHVMAPALVIDAVGVTSTAPKFRPAMVVGASEAVQGRLMGSASDTTGAGRDNSGMIVTQGQHLANTRSSIESKIKETTNMHRMKRGEKAR